MRYLPEAMLMLAVTAGLGLEPQAPAGGSASSRGDWRDKVDPWVLSTAASGDTEFLVYLAEQADVSGARALSSKEEKGRYVAARLQAVAAATQGPLLSLLADRGIEHRAFWVANMIWIRGGLDVVQEMAERDDVARVSANPRVAMQQPISEPDEGEAPEAIEWGVQKINAPQVWADGFTGQGVVIAGQDTGYQWDHPAIKNKYRGWNGSAADHNYNWHDAIHGGGGSCGPNSPVPCDDFGHGTHTMGTMVGDDGGANQIGVAPGARWIGCRNMDVGVGTPATYSECFQWFIAPTDLNNQNPDPARAPHVINNSWGCPPSEGCNPGSLQTIVENTRAAGIVVVVSAGNSGSGCSTVADPPAIYEASFSVGATQNTADDLIASFSSRGPVTIDGSGRLKPNISAPGVGVRSSLRSGGYGSMSGTSMAGPHVAGAVGLLLAAHPTLRGNVDAVETLLELTAVPRTTTQNCGGVPGTADPNNTYGYGRVDALSAVRPADVAVTLTASPNPATIGQPVTFTASVSNAGPGDASRAQLMVTLAQALTFVSATPSQGTCTFATVLTCVLGPIASGGSATVQIVTMPTATGLFTNFAEAAAGQIDPAPNNNFAAEMVLVLSCALTAPAISAPLDAPPGTTGLQASVPPAAGHTFAWTLAGGVITGGQGTNQITFTAASAGTTMILSVVESAAGCDSPPGRRNVQVHFLDVPPSHQFHTFVNTLARNQVTGGCGGGNYCPEASVAREQMAVFLLASREGSTYTPPACTTPVFADVPCSSAFAAWINELAARGVAGGCGGGNYCPAAAVTREQMAPLLLLTREGSGYTPPACSAPVFADVPCASPFARWINELSARGVTSGCGGGNYCPAAPNTRGEMAVFLVRTFGLN